MLVNEEARMQWIRENLHIMHDNLIYADAIWWFELMEKDFLTFTRLALFGFVVNMRGKAQQEIPSEVVSTYLKEFQYKICLAVAGDVRIKGLPLFSIVGVELLGEELLKGDASFRIHPGGAA